MLKLELHAHTSDDPADRIPHTTEQLIDRAAALGYGALAITLHNRYFDPAPHAAYARTRGIVLLPGVERTIAHRHLLLVNFPSSSAAVQSFEDVAQLKAHSNGLVVAPHPFYPTISALRGLMDVHAAIIDAVEVNAMYTRSLDFNRRAVAWARTHSKPMVGNGDVHRLEQLGFTYSLVDAAADPDSICAAIRAGRVEVRTEPLRASRVAMTLSKMIIGGAAGRLRRAAGRVSRPS